MKRIILTGATSMLGVALINECIKNQIEVLAIIRPNSSNVNRIPKNSLITILECDLNNLVSLLGDPKVNSCDVFYHFGWEATGKGIREDACMQNNNIHYTLDAVKIAAELNCKKFIGAGSQAEYGRVNSVISPTTMTNPEIAYGVAKYAAGKLSAILCKQLGIQHIWSRIFSVYGPYDNNHTMIMYCIDKLLKGEKPLLTKCEQQWDYLYSEDAARAFYLLGDKGKDQTIYCIGSGRAKMLREYVHILKESIDNNVQLGVGELEYAPNQVMQLCADIDNLCKDTGFVPQISFEEGISKTIEWFKKEVNSLNNR